VFPLYPTRQKNILSCLWLYLSIHLSCFSPYQLLVLPFLSILALCQKDQIATPLLFWEQSIGKSNSLFLHQAKARLQTYSHIFVFSFFVAFFFSPFGFSSIVDSLSFYRE